MKFPIIQIFDGFNVKIIFRIVNTIKLGYNEVSETCQKCSLEPWKFNYSQTRL